MDWVPTTCLTKSLIQKKWENIFFAGSLIQKTLNPPSCTVLHFVGLFQMNCEIKSILFNVNNMIQQLLIISRTNNFNCHLGTSISL